MALKLGFFLLLLSLHSSRANWSADEEQRIIKATFDKGNYDPSIRPPGKATVVWLHMTVRDFPDLDDKSSSLTLKMTLNQRWKDPRLKFSSSSLKYLSLASPDRVWTPDTIFRNERDSQLGEEGSVRVYSTGDVLYIRTVGVTVNCPMNLRRYPFDLQTCSVLISSHGLNRDMLHYVWEKDDPIAVVPGSEAGSFGLAAYSSGYSDVINNRGEISVARAIFTFKRGASHTVVTVFVPLIMFLMISMMSPWINIKDSASVFTRVVVSLTPLIMCTNRADQLNNKIPAVGYTKAVDTWTGSCVFFAFCIFAETILAIYLRKDHGENDEKTTSNMNIFQRFRNHPLHVKLDWITRILMPILICIFIVGFFCTYGSSNVSCPEDIFGNDVACLMDF